MAFNPDPTKQAVEVLFSQKNNEIYHPPLYFNNSVVLRVDSHKHLGLTLDSKLTFLNHVNEKIKATTKAVGILRYLRKYLPLNTLDQIYKMIIRPHFDYGDVIYHIPPYINPYNRTITLKPLMDRIEKVQYHAALAITGTWQGSSRNKLYEELGWESLSDRRWLRRLLLLYKIRNNMTPLYLRKNLPRERIPLYCNRSTSYHEFLCNTNKYMNSFFPDVIKSWNNLGSEFHNIVSLNIFKNKLISLIRPNAKSIFKLHDALGIKFLYQLRVGLSPLKCHKKNHNFVDTPDDWCACLSAPEDTQHFLLKCTLFSVQRVRLISNVSNLLANTNFHHLINDYKLYLYGHHALTSHVNKNILLSTILYINDTGRFE